MRRLEEDADGANFDAVFYDAERAGSEKAFYHQLNREIEKKQGLKRTLLAMAYERLRGIVTGDHKHSDLGGILGRLPPRQLLEAYLEQLNIREKPTIIMVDEIAIFALRLYRINSKRLEAFLSELRGLRQNYHNIRWLFTGSIGLDWVARRAEVEGALNDLRPFPFAPFSTEAARTFLERHVNSGGTRWLFELEDEAFLYLVSELGWLSPYYIEAIANEIIPSGAESPNRRKVANTNDVRKAFKALLVHHNRSYFSSWQEHISKNFASPTKERLYALLDACSRVQEGEELDTLLAIVARRETTVSRRDVRESLDILINDGYLSEDHALGRFKFTSGLLRRWWSRWMCDDQTT